MTSHEKCPKCGAEKVPSIPFYECGSYYDVWNHFQRSVDCLHTEFEKFRSFMLQELKNFKQQHG